MRKRFVSGNRSIAAPIGVAPRLMRALFLLISCTIHLCASAQRYPDEWTAYTGNGYMYDIQSDNNTRNLSETDFKSYLRDAALTNIARQVRINVQDSARMDKIAVDGRTSVRYASQTSFSTDVELRLVKTKTQYDPATKEGHAIAYINREIARDYYLSEMALILNKADNALTVAQNYIGSGFKAKAEEELKQALSTLGESERPLFWLGIFGLSHEKSSRLLERRDGLEQSIKKIIADLYNSISICLVCRSDIFGAGYIAIEDELKGRLAGHRHSFTDDPASADWVIRIDVSAREYNTMTVNGQKLYFAYADAKISIDKTLHARRIYEGAVSVKGGHVLGYAEAARTACKNLSDKLESIISENIRQ